MPRGIGSRPAGLRFFHGTREQLHPGELIAPAGHPEVGHWDAKTPCVYLTSNLDEAIWEAELATGEGPARVYAVDPIGQVRNAREVRSSRDHPWMSSYSSERLRVVDEVTRWTHYHGTRADLRSGDLIEPGRTPNYGDRSRETAFVYCTRTLDAAKWGAELASGEGRGRIYVVEPTGPLLDDPNLTDKRFRGNPTKSFRSRDPLRVVAEVEGWQELSPAAVKAMKENLARLARLGVQPIEE